MRSLLEALSGRYLPTAVHHRSRYSSGAHARLSAVKSSHCNLHRRYANDRFIRLQQLRVEGNRSRCKQQLPLWADSAPPRQPFYARFPGVFLPFGQRSLPIEASRTGSASALTQTKGAAEVSPAFAKPTKNLGGSDGGRGQGIVVRESFECVCALGPQYVDFVEELPFTRLRLALGLCASGGEDRRRNGK